MTSLGWMAALALWLRALCRQCSLVVGLPFSILNHWFPRIGTFAPLFCLPVEDRMMAVKLSMSRALGYMATRIKVAGGIKFAN